ncbi:hypothetical protein IHQ68_04920 [Chelatococcus sambhunathii]|uniref:Uncharacterized protein n=1 Tax=Chelatococcus sambhunathii TaxID=363953 RepID=A0ABU1DCY5_9HYPH|nr:hypothetical protein [Chelatococcus sambhunathii]MDR4305966.1 hypothetical protein [Chelatococcus sambhunathii]
MAVDFVTIVNSENASNLIIQARSFEKFLEQRSVGTINIIINSFLPDEFYKYLLTNVVPHYGSLKEQVEIYPVSRFARPHLNCSQDVVGDAALLLISRLLDCPFYVAMRPGDHFIRPSRPGDFGDQSSTRSRAARVEARPHALRKAAASFDVLSAALPEAGAEFVADQLPFAFSTIEARQLVDTLEAQYQVPLDDIFAKVGGAIDPIYLYVASMLRKSTDIREVFKVGPRLISGLKLEDGASGVDAWIADADKRILANVDVLRDMPADDEVTSKLASFWVSCGLFEDEASASLAMPRSGARPLGAMAAV